MIHIIHTIQIKVSQRRKVYIVIIALLYTMKKHKHWFQFVEVYNPPRTKKTAEKHLAAFVCICGEYRTVELGKSKEGLKELKKK